MLQLKWVKKDVWTESTILAFERISTCPSWTSYLAFPGNQLFQLLRFWDTNWYYTFSDTSTKKIEKSEHNSLMYKVISVDQKIHNICMSKRTWELHFMAHGTSPSDYRMISHCFCSKSVSYWYNAQQIHILLFFLASLPIPCSHSHFH